MSTHAYVVVVACAEARHGVGFEGEDVEKVGGFLHEGGYQVWRKGVGYDEVTIAIEIGKLGGGEGG